MTIPHSSAQLITGMRALAKDLFATGVNALVPAASSTISLHPRTAQLACINAMRSAALEYCQTVLVAHSTIGGDAGIAASRLLKLAEDADGIDGVVAIVQGHAKEGPCNKRLALSFALAAAQTRLHRPWIFLSGMTGRREGGYRSVGAIVDAGTCAWIWPFGRPPAELPADPEGLLAASGDLFLSGPRASHPMNIDLILLA